MISFLGMSFNFLVVSVNAYAYAYTFTHFYGGQHANSKRNELDIDDKAKQIYIYLARKYTIPRTDTCPLNQLDVFVLGEMVIVVGVFFPRASSLV